MMDSLRSLDEMILFALNGSHSLALDGIIWTMTKPLTWIPFYVCLLYVIFKNNNLRNALLIVLLTGLLVLLADQGASGICKPYFARLRPTNNPAYFNIIDVVNNYRGGRYGFFSSHAANTFALLTFITLLFRNFRTFAILFVYAILNCYSRVYLGVHYPSDIAVGMLYGTLCGIVVYLLYRFIDKRINAQRSFYSTAYTSSGYAITDISILGLGLSLSLLYVIYRGILYASAF